MLERNRFVVKERMGRFAARPVSDIFDGETGQLVGTATPTVTFAWAAAGLIVGRGRVPVAVEVREKLDDSLVFVVRRSGVFFRTVEAVDSQGHLLGTYRAKRLSLTGGFIVFDANGNPFCDLRGKLIGSECTFVTPDGKAELGRVTRTWGGRAKELLTGAGTYGVEVDPDFADQPIAKMLMLGAALAVHGLFTRSGRAKSE